MKEIVVNSTKVACDGGTTSSHPKVWLQIDPAKGKVECPYCGQVYALDKNAAHSH